MIKTFLTWLKSLFLQFSFIINCVVDYAHLFKFQCFEDLKCWSIFKILWSCRPKNRSHIPKSFYGTTYIYAVKFCFLHRSPNWLHSAVLRFFEDGPTNGWTNPPRLRSDLPSVEKTWILLRLNLLNHSWCSVGLFQPLLVISFLKNYISVLSHPPQLGWVSDDLGWF